MRSVEDVARLLGAGADKVGVNTAAIARPALIEEIAVRFGAQVCVLSADARRVPADAGFTTPSGFEVTTHGGRESTGIDLLEWVREACDRGAGEVLLNSMDADGTKNGFDLEMLGAVRPLCPVPLIASGGAGSARDFVEAAKVGADAVLGASVFHFGELSISQVKQALSAAGFPVR